jgi:hypothetical protein
MADSSHATIARVTHTRAHTHTHTHTCRYVAEIVGEVSQNAIVDVTKLELASAKLAAHRASLEEDDFWDAKDKELLGATVSCIADEEAGGLSRERLAEFLFRHTYHLPMYQRPTIW